MCGIAGILSSDSGAHRDAVVRMLAVMGHRGPDGSGLWTSPSGLCVLGHRRLAILDLSESAHQPMVDGEERFVLSYNGECYNFPELRAELERRGTHFHSSGDTEVVLQALARDGTAALERFNAMFALALWDEREKRLLLARDRFGQKPLYWTAFRDGILFASEVRALLASGLVERRVSRAGVRSFLCYGAVQGPDTIVAGVQLLPRAATLSLRAGQAPRQAVYWEPARKQRPVAARDLRDAFAAAVKRHLVSDVPIGMFLSGGVDSSVVVASACNQSAGVVKSLAVVFPDQPDHSEAEHARRIAQRSKADHSEIPVTGRDMLSMLDQALDRLDQPTIDAVNTFIVSQAARQAGLTVALSGLGGDELFGGYRAFHEVPRYLKARRALAPVRALARRFLKRSTSATHRWSKLVELLDGPARVVPIYLLLRKLFPSRLLHALAPAIAGEGWLSGLDAEREAALETLAKDRPTPDAVAQLELEAYLGHTLLRDTDVMGMACSLEIRSPFLDAEFASLTLAQPSEVRLPRRKIRKWRLIEAFQDWLPEENWRRGKQGFVLPFEAWLRGDLRQRVQEELDSLQHAPSFFDVRAVRTLWESFQSCPAAVGWSRPWALFVLCHYLRQQKLT
ncbi:MAG TPA: asparagine synthase (glutamine-hydrolyzing) [Gemmataceae bacterium]|jgi:asparagine synthase (glutamine-hydrolysing)